MSDPEDTKVWELIDAVAEVDRAYRLGGNEPNVVHLTDAQWQLLLRWKDRGGKWVMNEEKSVPRFMGLEVRIAPDDAKLSVTET